MKKTIRKSLALLLAVLMLLTVSPMGFATELDPECEHEFAVTGSNWKAEDKSCDITLKCSKCEGEKVVNVAATRTGGTPATCTADGSDIMTAVYAEVTPAWMGSETFAVPALGHDFTGEVNPLNNGTHNWKCSREGCTAVGIMKEVTVDEETKTVPEENGTVDCTTEIEANKATCTTKAKCDVCGAEYGPDPTHTFVKVDEVKPTCTTGGNKAYYKCTVESCGKYFEVGADGNADTSKEITDKESVNLPAIEGDHIKSDIWELVGLDGAPYNCLQPGKRVKKCTKCHVILESEDVEAAAAHSVDENEWVYEAADGTAFRCEDGGKRYHECTVCGEKRNEETVKPTTTHEDEMIDAVEATCGKPGHNAYQKCKRCGREVGKVTTDPKDHEWKEVPAKEPKCNETGNEAYYICKNCGVISRAANEANKINDILDEEGNVVKTALEQVTIAKTAHHFESYADAKPASCTLAGRTEVFRCKDCEQLAIVVAEAGEDTYEIDGTIYKDIASLDDAKTEPLGHNWYEDKEEDSVGYVKPTCSQKGSFVKFCLRCDKKETVEIPALEHVKDEPVKDAEGNPVVGAATCEEPAFEKWTCQNCHEEFKVYSTEPALGHVWGDAKVSASPASCTQKATIGYKCDRCGAFKDLEEVGELLPHTFETVVEPADCTHDGKSYKRCTTCNLVQDEVVIKGEHVDTDPKDGYCDRCGVYISCDHICHKTDGFSKFIWFILNVWNQFLGINQTCKCGELHYVKSGSIVVPD